MVFSLKSLKVDSFNEKPLFVSSFYDMLKRGAMSQDLIGGNQKWQQQKKGMAKNGLRGFMMRI